MTLRTMTIILALVAILLAAAWLGNLIARSGKEDGDKFRARRAAQVEVYKTVCASNNGIAVEISGRWECVK